MSRQRWILLIYKVPPTPAKHRIHIWRKLKKLGVLYLQKSICVIPENAYLRDELENIAHDIENVGGEATLVFTDKIEKEEKLVEAFLERTNEEYNRIVRGVDKLSFLSKKSPSPRELKGAGRVLEELRKAFSVAQRNDWLGAGKGKEAEKKLRELEERYLQALRGS